MRAQLPSNFLADEKDQRQGRALISVALLPNSTFSDDANVLKSVLSSRVATSHK